jgi:hypothetical protein
VSLALSLAFRKSPARHKGIGSRRTPEFLEFSLIATRTKEESTMKRKPQTQSRHNVSTLMTKLNQAGRENLDELRALTEVLLDLPVSNAVILQRGLQLYLDDFKEQLRVAQGHGENGLNVIASWMASERLNLIRAAEGNANNKNLEEEPRTE